MFCRNCGKELKDDWSMCPYCNTKILESQNMENMSNLNVDGREDFNNTGNIKRKVEKNETGKYDKYGFVKQIDDFLKDYEKHNNKK